MKHEELIGGMGKAENLVCSGVGLHCESGFMSTLLACGANSLHSFSADGCGDRSQVLIAQSVG